VTFQRKIWDSKQIKVGGKSFEKVGDELSNNQCIILDCMRENNTISARQLPRKIGISQRKIEENI